MNKKQPPLFTLGQEKDREEVDGLRMKRLRLKYLKEEEVEKEEEREEKEVIQMHKFREEARKQQREINQSTHEYIKMASFLSHNLLGQDRFRIDKDEDQQKIKNNTNQINQKSLHEKLAPVSINYDAQIQSNIVSTKVQLRSLYHMFPFKKESIEIQPSQWVDPKFQFFIFQHQYPRRKEILDKFNSEIDDNSPSQEFKYTLKHVTNYVDFFDYIYLINKEDIQPRNEKKYPDSVNEIAKNSADHYNGSDDEKGPNRIQLAIPERLTSNRLIECEMNELAEPENSIYFPSVDQYVNYRSQREIEFKKKKIYDNDFQINTDVRNIISSEKIYLIQIKQEMKLYIQIVQELNELKLMQSIHKQMMEKQEEYLRLVCGYTQSSILSKFNIDSPHEKIRQFLQKSIKFDKSYLKPEREVLEKFPVLQIWYKVPMYIFGCQIHQPLYDLIKATLKLERKIKYLFRYEELKIKKANIKYDMSKK